MSRLKILWWFFGRVVLARNYPSPFAGLLDSFQIKVTAFFSAHSAVSQKTNKRPLPYKGPVSNKCHPSRYTKISAWYAKSSHYGIWYRKTKTTRCKQTKSGDINLASINLPCGQTTFPLHLWWITPFWSRRKIWSLALQAVPCFLVKMR